MKGKLITSLIMLIFILLVATNVNAAIEIKPATTAHSNITASNSFEYCYNMRNPTSSLGNNTLDPHLTLNKDWGAVAYLGLSGYGTVKSITGDSCTIDGTSYTTTNGNPTGVLNFGASQTQTSTVRYDTSEGSTGYPYRTKLLENKNTEYVEILTGNTIAATKGQALTEIGGWFGSSYSFPDNHTYPVVLRTDILGSNSGPGTNNVATYRPVIWN